MQAGMVDALGWSEAALRIPSALASLGTMITTYYLRPIRQLDVDIVTTGHHVMSHLRV